MSVFYQLRPSTDSSSENIQFSLDNYLNIVQFMKYNPAPVTHPGHDLKNVIVVVNGKMSFTQSTEVQR